MLWYEIPDTCVKIKKGSSKREDNQGKWGRHWPDFSEGDFYLFTYFLKQIAFDVSFASEWQSFVGLKRWISEKVSQWLSDKEFTKEGGKYMSHKTCL